MDALHKTLVLAVAVAAILCVLPAFSDSSDGEGETDGLLLYAINFDDSPEGVAVHNYGSTAVNMSGYYISDDQERSKGGTLSFSSSIVVQPGQTVAFVDGIDGDNDFQIDMGTCYSYDRAGSQGVTDTGNFALVNNGDDIYLWHGNSIIDAFCYDNVYIDDPNLWNDDRSYTTFSDSYVIRMATYDHDDQYDWCIPGETVNRFDELEDIPVDSVTPFVFPDSGGIPVYQALDEATESIHIEIYQITSKNLYALLCQKAEEGLEIQLLLEGNSLGQNDPLKTNGPEIMRLLEIGDINAENGGVDNVQVRAIGVGDESHRFSYVHAKYAVIDGDTTVVTSENWTSDNLSGELSERPYSGAEGNRGWGAIIESREYAAYMEAIFRNDFSTEYGDVMNYTDMEEYQNISANGSLYYVPPEEAEFQSFSNGITVRPVVSDDNSYEAMRYYIQNATERVYAQQQSLDQTYDGLHETSPLWYINEADKRGVECVVILSSGANNADSETYLLNSTTGITASTMDDPYVHNKGLICDDHVWVTSVNWTENSFFNNREVGAVINSAEVADYFAAYLLQDLEDTYTYEGMSVEIQPVDGALESGEPYAFTVTVSPRGDYTYTWDFGDGSEPVTTDIERISYTPTYSGDGEGTFTLRVTVTDNTGELDPVSASLVYTVTEETGFLDSFGEYMYIIVIIIVLIVVGIVSGKRRSKGRSTKTRRK